MDEQSSGVDLYRAIARMRPEVGLPALAEALTEEVAPLVDAGRDFDAVQAVDEAVEIYRLLAESGSEQDQDVLAGALHQRAMLLNYVGCHEGLEEAFLEAISYRRRSGMRSPQVLEQFARLLRVRADNLDEQGRTREALRCTDEAISLYEEVALRSVIPDESRHNDYLEVLQFHSKLLMEDGRKLAALEANEKLVAGARYESPSGSIALAEALTDRALFLSQLDSDGEALAAADEAIALFGEFDPDHGPDFARALEIQSRLLARYDNFAESTFANDRAVKIYRSLPGERPALARALIQKALLAEDLMEWNALFVEPIECLREAVQILRQEVVHRPDSYRGDLAHALELQADTLLLREYEYEEALDVVSEAVALRREVLATTDSSESRVKLTRALLDMAETLSSNDMAHKAFETAHEALNLVRRVAEEDPSPAATKLLLASLEGAARWGELAGDVSVAMGLKREAKSLRQASDSARRN